MSTFLTECLLYCVLTHHDLSLVFTIVGMRIVPNEWSLCNFFYKMKLLRFAGMCSVYCFVTLRYLRTVLTLLTCNRYDGLQCGHRFNRTQYFMFRLNVFRRCFITLRYFAGVLTLGTCNHCDGMQFGSSFNVLNIARPDGNGFTTCYETLDRKTLGRNGTLLLLGRIMRKTSHNLTFFPSAIIRELYNGFALLQWPRSTGVYRGDTCKHGPGVSLDELASQMDGWGESLDGWLRISDCYDGSMDPLA